VLLIAFLGLWQVFLLRYHCNHRSPKGLVFSDIKENLSGRSRVYFDGDLEGGTYVPAVQEGPTSSATRISSGISRAVLTPVGM
jgi:hypothetical protein